MHRLFIETFWSVVKEIFKIVLKNVNWWFGKNSNIYNFSKRFSPRNWSEDNYLSPNTSRGSYLDLELLTFWQKVEFYLVS